MRWYQKQWWYVERPFPIVAVIAIGIPAAIITCAVVLGIWWFH